MKKKMVAMLLVLTMIGSLTGCGKTEDTGGNTTNTDAGARSGEGGGSAESIVSGEGEDGQVITEGSLEFVYVTQDSANSYFIQVYEGFSSKCEELGVRTQILDAKYDVAAQVSYVEDAVQRGVDGIMISPLDENALKNIVDEAKEKGIVVSAEAQPVSNAQIDGSLDEYNIGYSIGSAAAQWINEQQGGEGKALILAQDDVEAVIRRGDGINDGILENAPNAEIVARQNASNTDLGMKVTESVILANPEVNVICACDDFTAIGAYEAVSAMQNIADSFYFGGCDATDEGKEKMKAENSVYRSSCNLFPYEAGEELAEAMYVYLTETQEDAVVERRYEPVWQQDVIEQ